MVVLNDYLNDKEVFIGKCAKGELPSISLNKKGEVI